jgi:hypothetical protein
MPAPRRETSILADERVDAEGDFVAELARKDLPVVVVAGYEITQPVADNAFATPTKPFSSAPYGTQVSGDLGQQAVSRSSRAVISRA